MTNRQQWYHGATMPSLNVRLSPEQHGELRSAAQKAGRSIQQEMALRLFPPVVEEPQAPTVKVLTSKKPSESKPSDED